MSAMGSKADIGSQDEEIGGVVADGVGSTTRWLRLCWTPIPAPHLPRTTGD
jgi:hypothetical protein